MWFEKKEDQINTYYRILWWLFRPIIREFLRDGWYFLAKTRLKTRYKCANWGKNRVWVANNWFSPSKTKVFLQPYSHLLYQINPNFLFFFKFTVINLIKLSSLQYTSGQSTNFLHIHPQYQQTGCSLTFNVISQVLSQN